MALTMKDGKPVPVPQSHWLNSWWLKGLLTGIAALPVFVVFWGMLFDASAYPLMDNLWRMIFPCAIAGLFVNFMYGPVRNFRATDAHD